MSFGADIPFVHLLGFRMVRMQDGEAEVHFDPQPEHLNSLGVTHGGASMTLLDVTMAMAARSLAPENAVVTVEMKTTFMRAAHGPLVARARLLHRTPNLAFTEATVVDAQGRACTHATGTFNYVRRKPAGTPAAEAPEPAPGVAAPALAGVLANFG